VAQGSDLIVFWCVPAVVKKEGAEQYGRTYISPEALVHMIKSVCKRWPLRSLLSFSA
jgi:hypothetical protein